MIYVDSAKSAVKSCINPDVPIYLYNSDNLRQYNSTNLATFPPLPYQDS